MARKRNEGLVEDYPVKSSSSSPVVSRGRTYERNEVQDGINLPRRDGAPENKGIGKGSPLSLEDINSRALEPERSFKNA